MPADHFRRLLTQAGVWTARPLSFLIVLAYGVAWVAISPASFNWQGVAMIATWMMTLVIQRAEHRDTEAIHAKLGELLNAVDGARTWVATLDKAEPEEIEELRRREQKSLEGGDRPPVAG